MSPKDAGFHRNPSDAKVTQIVELMDLSVPMESGRIQPFRPATDNAMTTPRSIRTALIALTRIDAVS